MTPPSNSRSESGAMCIRTEFHQKGTQSLLYKIYHTQQQFFFNPFYVSFLFFFFFLPCFLIDRRYWQRHGMKNLLRIFEEGKLKKKKTPGRRRRRLSDRQNNCRDGRVYIYIMQMNIKDESRLLKT